MRHNTPEKDLIARLRKRDPQAVEELSTRYSARIFQLAFRSLKNREDAEEVVQDVLMKVYRKIDRFRGDAALSSWIYRITFNTSMSRLRHTRAARTMEVSDEITTNGDEQAPRRREPADWSKMGDERVLRLEMRQALAGAVDTLPAIYRAPVVLRDLKGLTTEEASRTLSLKDQTLKSRLHRGRLLLRKRLVDFSDGLVMHREAAA